MTVAELVSMLRYRPSDLPEGDHNLEIDTIWLDQAAATIERLQKERDDLSKRLERMHRPRCEGYSDDPEGPWPLLQNPCQFCGSRSESDACRDMADTADCDKIREERDAAQAEVERLKGEVKWWKREAATGQDNVNFITQQERDWR